MAEQNASQAITGLNLESTGLQRKEGEMSYVLNAITQGFDGEAYVLQSEQGNEHCLNFPDGFKVMGGPFSIPHINTVIYFLANPSTGDSRISISKNRDCELTTLLEGKCLNFSIYHPIHELVIKTTNCSTQVYWTDNFNVWRYIDLQELPWVEERNPENDFLPIKHVGQVDCNKMRVQPFFSIPDITGERELLGGTLKMGVYQAGIQYANVLGEGMTSIYNISNPFGIFKDGEGLAPDAETNKAIEYEISHLDTTGLYDFYNVIVIKTINNIPTPYVVGKGIPITGKTAKYLYTGNEKEEPITIDEVFLKFRYYDTAKGVMEVDNVIVWHGLKTAKDINYQKIWNSVKVEWETWKVPYNEFEGYRNGVNMETVRGYMRDEVYAVEGVFLLRNGQQTQKHHIPGRPPTQQDLTGVAFTNKDSRSILENPCDELEQKAKWQVYNTASLSGYCQEYLDFKGEKDCYKGPYQYGEMGYWESERLYPNNPVIWGDLRNTPIRHHKFPDSGITHIHDNNPTGDKNYKHSIYPIGLRITGVYEAIQASDLTQEEKDNIIGFKIVRGNRASHKSIVAKGMFNNVGKYTYVPTEITEEDSQTYYFPNYPFNDLRPDPYFTTELLKDHAGYRPDKRIDGFNNEDSHSRFVFYSPDTQFFQPNGIDSGHIKMETITYGEAYGHFIAVDQNAKYLFINKNGFKVAYGAGLASTINGELSYTTPWSYKMGANWAPENFAPTYQSMLELLEKILPKSNFGYTFNSIGYYNKYFPIPNDGEKIRNISFGKYLTSEYETIEPGNTINNYQREGSVYLFIDDSLPHPHQYDGSIPQDTSRYNLSSYTNNEDYAKFFPLFLRNNGIVKNADIETGMIFSWYEGSQVVTVVYNNAPYEVKAPTTAILSARGNSFASPPTSARDLVALDVFGDDQSDDFWSKATFWKSSEDGMFTGRVVDGDIDDVTAYMLIDSSSKKDDERSDVVYSNDGGNIVYTTPGEDPFKVKHIMLQTWQQYTTTSPSGKAKEVDRIRGLLAGIHTLEDLEALNVKNPTTDDDFSKIAAYEAYFVAYVRFQQTLEKQFSPDKIRQSNICSYYGSIKKDVPTQWGDIYSYETVDTGFYSPLLDDSGKPITTYPTVFGGDIFINKYAFKIKMPFFEDHTVNLPNQADIEFDKIANYTYPMFWISTRPTSIRSNIAAFIEKKAKQIIKLSKVPIPPLTMAAGFFGLQIAFEVIKEVLYGLGVRNLNLDNFMSVSLYEIGLMYMFAYGIPYYFCESEVNVDYRSAADNRAGNFYPRAAGEIPDRWLQEANVPILTQEQFNYNVTYSKQNKENYFAPLRLDYDPEKACFYDLDNQAAWSDKASLEETKNNWLTYRPANMYNFPKSFGKLTALNKVQNKTVLARFENQAQIYNAMVRIDTSSPEGAFVGNDALFSGTPPIDLAIGKEGSGGSQHKFLLVTELGSVYCDAKRGQVILLRGQQAADMSTKGADKWFKHNLPYFIEKIQGVNIDNHYKDIGLLGVYDSLYKRVIITKRDFEPLVDGITYENNEFIYEGNVISLYDTKYFCDRSWSISYSFLTETWTSFHSYIPNFYIEFSEKFQSGLNNEIASLWDHNTSYTSYHTYYGKVYPYILEYPIMYKGEDEILQGIRDYTVARKHTTFENYTVPDGILYFSKAIVWNDQQCSGIRNLIPKKGLSSYASLPKWHQDSIDIQVSKGDSFYNINDIWNITKDLDKPIWTRTCAHRFTDKLLNLSNLNYDRGAYNKARMRAKNCYIRLIEDQASDIRLISRFLLSGTMKSKK